MGTIKDPTDENSGEISLLCKVQPVEDIWSVGIIGPGQRCRVVHGSNLNE